jgi:hypothetical protein
VDSLLRVDRIVHTGNSRANLQAPVKIVKNSPFWKKLFGKHTIAANHQCVLTVFTPEKKCISRTNVYLGF